jgi:NSS family neurotransmitter:Na+ symporter
MVATGFVVGFGNFWRLPLLAGEQGGGAFWLIYILAMAFIGIPLMIALMFIGVQGRSNPAAAWREAARVQDKSPRWQLVAWLAFLAAFCLIPLNAVVGGWSLAYIGFAWSGQLSEQEVNTIAPLFSSLVSDIKANVYWSGMVMGLATAMSAARLPYGLGMAGRVLVPLVFALLVVVAWVFRHFGDMDHTMYYLFVSHWDQVSGATLVSAVSQVFFTLTLGAGVFMAMGAYLPNPRELLVVATGVAVADTLAAVLTGYVLLPLVFAANIAPEAGGSGLLFVSVPVAFGNVIYGVEMTVALYLAVTLLALVSIAALMEPIVVTLNEKLGLHRALAALLTGGFAWLAAIAVAEHFSSDTVLGLPFDINMMALFGLASQYLMPVVALLTVVFLGWVVDQRFLAEELEMFSPILVRFWRILLRWVALPAILLVLALPIYDKIATPI